ncbi:hypothetical protein DIPPA_04948 [Diplonema papillatum]|nr:hypothetical protein DIPPA_04948 [Diplonema papillatum]
MLAFLDENRSPKNVDAGDPRVKVRKQLQSLANTKVSERQRQVLPEGYRCALWSFQVPWAPFEYYVSSPCPETKPFIWTAPFTVSNTEWMLFIGAEPMEAENRTSLWVAVCNNLTQPVTAYTKLDLLVPTHSSHCGETVHIGDAVDTLNSCGQVHQQNKFGRFWWHKSPEDFKRCLFKGAGDTGPDRSFELILTLNLDVRYPAERSPAPEEDPKLWETSCKYLRPWIASRAACMTAPLEDKLRHAEEALASAQKKARDAQAKEQAALKREDAAIARAAKLEGSLSEAHQREEQSKKQLAGLEGKLKEAKTREDQLRVKLGNMEAKLKEAGVREAELRKWGKSLQQQVKESKDREDKLVKDNQRLEEHIKNTAIREERLQSAIRKLEADLKNGKLAEGYLLNTVQKLRYNVTDCQEREEMLRQSNGRLYQACTDERVC